jgi:hypothetical protein
MNNTGIFDLILLKFCFLTKFEKEIVFESSVLAWIRIRITSIHNPAEKGEWSCRFPVRHYEHFLQ